MRIPAATYRVQLNQRFQFKDARALLPYLERIGITDLYASPVFQARTGSMHGYDVTDPTRVNSELGTPEEFDALIEDLHARGMNLLLDIVPNHMAASLENPWWMDVLENGSASVYAACFDIEWGHRTPSVRDKIVLPVLGEPYGSALEWSKLQLGRCDLGFCVNYGESAFPIDPATYHGILSYRLDDFLRGMQVDDTALQEFGSLLETAERLPARTVTDWEVLELRRRESAVLKEKLWAVYRNHSAVKQHIDGNIVRFNGTQGESASFDLLHNLLDQQPYQLMFWRVARERINYRRFFDVTDLISIRAQDPQVFQATHELTLRWLEQNKAKGLRIDHVDGLYDPLAYLAHLQARASRAAGEAVYIVVEKVLSGDENLPNEWPVAGTTGYEFLGAVNNLFVQPEGLQSLTRTYSQFVKDDTTFYELAYSQKRKIMEDLFAGEIRTLGLQVNRIAERYRDARDLSPEALTIALREVTASMPVYRTYTREFHVGARDRAFIEDAIAGARRRNTELNPACFSFLARVLLVQLADDEDALRFVMRWQQITGPVMAKGIEDTTLYRYNRLTSMNDVGGSPEPVSTGQFHAFNSARSLHWPGTLNATSTHDTKRSEDVRARINVLSEIAPEWERNVNRWHNWNKLSAGSDFPTIDPNQEYLLYQTLVGIWPLDDIITGELIGRVKNYMLKSAREAKVHTNWLNQDEDYERKMLAFVDAILQESGSNRFLARFRRFQRRTAFYGAVNALSQTLLKMVCPGVPDFYQGTTLWDFSLVDPDNRRPAQIAPRLELLDAFEAWRQPLSPETVALLLECWIDGRVKAMLIFKTLQFRKEHADLFEHGEYLGLDATGLASGHTVSVLRKRGAQWALAVVPRFTAGFSALEKWPIGKRVWQESSVTLPEDAPVRWVNVFTGQMVSGTGALQVAEVLKSFPAALLTSRTLPGSLHESGTSGRFPRH